MNASFSLIYCGILQFSRLIYSLFSFYLLHFHIATIDYFLGILWPFIKHSVYMRSYSARPYILLNPQNHASTKFLFLSRFNAIWRHLHLRVMWSEVYRPSLMCWRGWSCRWDRLYLSLWSINQWLNILIQCPFVKNPFCAPIIRPNLFFLTKMTLTFSSVRN